MRQIGELSSEPAARLFGDFLYTQGIENQIDSDKDHGWTIWVLEDDKLERAGQLFAEFQAAPSHPRFAAQAAVAADLREQARKEQAATARKTVTARETFRPLYAAGFGPVTLILIAASVVVFFVSKYGDNLEPIYGLFFSEYGKGMPEILHGEVWRLVTPMFIHFTFLHIFFNMLWLRDLGSALELRHGSLFFILLVVVVAIVSNAVQYFIGGPRFGGMSGVVYGLLSYIWISGKLNPGFGLFLNPSTVAMMAIWFVLCWTGLLGSVANWCHAAGLLTGLAWGYLAALKNR